jgi:serine protease Do
MTQGIISAKGRHVPIIASHDPSLQGLTYENFLQTDAAINPGNSGGPLVNLRGEVVGINAAIASNTGAYNGIGFSIPSNDAQYIMKSLIEHGKVVRGYLGVMIEDIAHPAPRDKSLAEAARKEGFKGDKGILISEVNADGPGGRSGLQSGDVITSINGKPVDSVDELRNQIARTAPNSKIDLGVFRTGKQQQISATVGLQPATNEPTGIARGADQQPGSADAKDLGITVQDLTPRQARNYGLKEGEGVVITQVNPRGLASELGLTPGDVVTRLDGKEVTSSRQFNDVLGSAKLSNGVKMMVRTQNGMDRLVYLEQK